MIGVRPIDDSWQVEGEHTHGEHIQHPDTGTDARAWQRRWCLSHSGLSPSGLSPHTHTHTHTLSPVLSLFPAMSLPFCVMSHVTYQWVMSHVNASRHICMSCVTLWGREQIVDAFLTQEMHESCRISVSWGLESGGLESMVSCRISVSHVTSRHTSMSHVTYKYVMPHLNKSCHISMSHVTYEWVMSHMDESCHFVSEGAECWCLSDVLHGTYQCVTSHINE